MVFCVNEAHIRLSAFGSVYPTLLCESFQPPVSLCKCLWYQCLGDGLKKFKILQLNSAWRKVDTKVRLRIKKLIRRAAEQRKRPRLQQNIFLIAVLLCKKKLVVIGVDDGEKMLWKPHTAKRCQWFISRVFWLLLQHCQLSAQMVAGQALAVASIQQNPAGPGHWSRCMRWLRSRRLHLHPSMNVSSSKLFHALLLLQFWICV